MFERLNEKARRVIFLGRFETVLRGQSAIAVEDLVLGTLIDNQNVLRSQYGIMDSLDLIDQIRNILPRSREVKEIELHFSVEAKKAIEEATGKSEIHVTQWLLLWVMYPSINSQVVAVLDAHGITRDSLTEKKLV